MKGSLSLFFWEKGKKDLPYLNTQFFLLKQNITGKRKRDKKGCDTADDGADSQYGCVHHISGSFSQKAHSPSDGLFRIKPDLVYQLHDFLVIM